LNNSSIVIASSQWAVDSATSHYNQSSAKCKVLEFGANLDDEDIVKSDKYEKGDVLNVLFSGVNWERKGAAIAIDTVKKLINTGINAKLLLVGIKLDDIPANYRNLPWVEYFGFMNRTCQSSISVMSML
jgi:glycosyltransferase involved in cell wall biosynthesis